MGCDYNIIVHLEKFSPFSPLLTGRSSFVPSDRAASFLFILCPCNFDGTESQNAMAVV